MSSNAAPRASERSTDRTATVSRNHRRRAAVAPFVQGVAAAATRATGSGRENREPRVVRVGRRCPGRVRQRPTDRETVT